MTWEGVSCPDPSGHVPMTTTEERPAARTAVDGAWRLNVLGPVELCYDGVPVEVAGPTRTLLALLARTPCEEVPTATIVAGMWGSEPPEDSEKEVASYVARLRKALTAVAPDVDPTSVVVTLPAGYILAIQPANADILTFERLLADGRRALAVGQPALAVQRLDAALALWRGEAYEDFGELPFARAEAERLADLKWSAIESRVDALLAIAAPSAPPNLATELSTMVAEHWHRERLWGQLMTVLVRLGRRADALAVHRRAQQQLAQHLGAHQGAELRTIEAAVIDRDPRLFGVPLQPTTVPDALAVTVPPLVGREQEVAWLLAAIDLAATRRAQARLVVGTPGMGKSRMVAEVAQRATERSVNVHYFRASARGLDAHLVEPDRVTLIVIEDLDQAPHEDVARVTSFVRSVATRPVVTIVTCRDPVRVGDLASVPKLVLSALDDAAIADIVRAYAPSVAEKTAVAAMANTGGVPARVHRAASEWAFARAGRRIDRAVADSAEPRRTLDALREEIVAGALELAYVRSRARSLRPASRISGCPYPGLTGFGPGDADHFVGRERFVAQVLSRLVEAPLLAIVGDPGAGKTSVLRAGVLPAIAAGVLPESSRWRQIVVTPSTAPALAELLAPPPAVLPQVPELVRSNPLTTPTALLPIMALRETVEVVDDDEEEEDLPVDEVPDFTPVAPADEGATESSEDTTDRPRPFIPSQVPVARMNGILPTGALASLTPLSGIPVLPLATNGSATDGGNGHGSNGSSSVYGSVARREAGSRATRVAPTVPLVDESIEDTPGTVLVVVDQFEEVFLLEERQRLEFLDALMEATSTGRVLLCLRADFYGHCGRYPELAGLIAANTLPMPAMTEEELRRVIERPAAAAGLDVEPGLVDRLVAEVQDGNGSMAHLGLTLRELWHHRTENVLTLASYQSGPGLAAAVEAYAESVFAELATPQARVAGRALLAGLCELVEGRLPVRVRANLTDLLARTGPGALPALEALTRGGLVHVSPETDEVELRHDCLLVAWPRLREALEDGAAESSLRRHLRRAAGAWAANGRSATAVYKGARLVAALDWSERNGRELTTVEREFLAAGQRAMLVDQTRRQRRNLLLWKWFAGVTALAVLATAVATVAVTMAVRAAEQAKRADAARLGVQALAETDPRTSLLLAVAAARLDSANASAVRSALQRIPDAVAMAGTGVATIALSPDGSLLAAGTTGGPILLLRADTLAVTSTLDYPGHGPVNGLAFSPDGRRLVSWGGSHSSASVDAASVVVWDVGTGRPTGTAFGQVWPDTGGGLLADRVTLVLAQHGRDPQSPATLVAWNIEARTPSTAYPLPTSTVDTVLVSPDGGWVAVASGGNTVVVDPLDGEQLLLTGAIVPLAFSPDGRYLLAGAGSTVQVWDLTVAQDDDGGKRNGRGSAAAAAGAPIHLATPPRTVVAHRDQVTAAAWSGDGASFATLGADGTAVVWGLASLSPVRSFAAGVTGTADVTFAADNRTLFVLGSKGTVIAFDLTGSRGVGAALASTPDDDPALLALACGLAGRGLTPEEWASYLPDRPFQQVC